MAAKLVTGLACVGDSVAVTENALEEALGKLGGSKPGLAFVHASSKCDYRKVLETVRARIGGVPVVGCSTAGHFTENRVGEGGVAIGLISSDSMLFSTAIARGLRYDPEDVARNLAQAVPTVEPGRHLTAILFADGLSGAGEELSLCASRLFEKYAGCPVTLIGGFAGDDLRFTETRVFHGLQESPDAAVACFITSEKPFHTGVKHGHTPLSLPHTVTLSKGNRVYEVDGRPAWEMWSRETGYAMEHLKSRYRVQSPEDQAKLVLGNFELGLSTDGDEYKIRFPMAVNPDGSMMFTCSIPEGTIFRIMDGSNTDTQIEASRIAAKAAFMEAERSGQTDFAGMLVFECGIRLALLEDSFTVAIDSYRKIVPGKPVLGWETYGEIRMPPGSYSGFHNTTTVVALIPES